MKNISFLMDRNGVWRLAPAYDMTFSYRPDSIWTSKHQMQINGKCDNLTLEDLRACGRSMDISDKRIREIIGDVVEAVRNWPKYAECAGVGEQAMERVRGFHKYSWE